MPDDVHVDGRRQATVRSRGGRVVHATRQCERHAGSDRPETSGNLRWPGDEGLIAISFGSTRVDHVDFAITRRYSLSNVAAFRNEP